MDWIATLLLLVRAGITLALYTFLLWAFWLLWQELSAHTQMINSRQTPAIKLQIAMPNGMQTLLFQEPEIFIGRDASCQCILPDATISAQHARLSFHHQQWWIEDLNSTNGTFIHEEAVSTPAVLTSGDHVRCGRVEIGVQIVRAGVSES